MGLQFKHWLDQRLAQEIRAQAPEEAAYNLPGLTSAERETRWKVLEVRIERIALLDEVLIAMSKEERGLL